MNKLLQTTLEYCTFCTSSRLEVTGLYHGKLLQLTLKTSLNTNFVNITNSTLNAGSLSWSLPNLLKYLFLKFQISTTYFCSPK